jgi:hypothetical protein
MKYQSIENYFWHRGIDLFDKTEFIKVIISIKDKNY